MTVGARIAATVAVLAVAAPGAAPLAAQDDGPKPPRGTYKGRSGVTLSVAGPTISTAAFNFACRRTTGRTTLNEIRITRSRGRWRFSIRTHGSATYADDHPDENVRVRFSGTFSRNEARVTGTFVVRSPHCGSTGEVQWSARR